jgi:hypothetical protein
MQCGLVSWGNVVAETPVQMARRHVAEQEARIVRQQELIARLTRQGHPTADAEDLLKSMEDWQAAFRADLARLSN